MYNFLSLVIFPTTHFEGMNLHSVPFVAVLCKVLNIGGSSWGSSCTHKFII